MRLSIAGLLFFCASVPVYATTVTVSTAAALVSAVNSANNGDVIQMNDGTYSIGNVGGIGLNITKSIILKSINGPTAVTLTASTSYIAIQVNSSNVTVDGLTIGGAQWGVQVTAFSGAVLRNLVVSTVGTGGHSVGLQSSTNSVIERCTLNNSYNHGVSLYGGANYNLIINNTIQATQTGHGVAVVTSDHNIISGNTINNTYFDGVTLNGSQYNYVGLNKINLPHNGVTLTKDIPSSRQSIGNFVGNNTVVGNPSNPPGGSDGLWFDYDSNYNMAFGNDTRSSQENAMAVFNSVGNYIRGNVYHENPHGGIFVWNTGGSSGTTPPAYNSIQQNYLYNHAANGGVTLDNAPNTDISFNYIAGASSGTPIAGLLLRTTSSNTTAAGNVIRDLLQGEQIEAGVSNTSLFLNRHINTPNHYDFSGSTLWDTGSAVLGGNFFSDFLSANGNPSNGSTPYTNIIYDNQGHTGVRQDHYPYQSESLGRQYLVSAVLPSTGSSLPVNSLKTIAWNSQGCVLVDLTLLGSTNTTIATNAPDYGYYRWTVPNVTPGAYTVRVDCKDSTGSPVRATNTSASFNVTGPDLLLLSPQTSQVLDSGSSMLISWAKSASVTLPVDVYIAYGIGTTYTLLQSGVTADSLSVVTPANSSNLVSVKIVSGSYADSTDGFFTIRASTTGVFSAPTATTLLQGTAVPVQWISPQTTTYVDLDLIAGGGTKNIATKLADFGGYLMLLPAVPGSGAYLRLTFHNASGSVLNTAQSVSFTIASYPVQPVTIVALSGTPQSSNQNGSFLTTLQAIVRDANSNPQSGVSVTFTAPSSGASGSFNGTLACGLNPSSCSAWTVTTDASGIATAPGYSSNGISGSYVVTATSPSASGSAAFNLTNTPQPPRADSVSPGSGTGGAQTFTAVYSDGDGFGVINRRLFLLNSSLTGSAGCFVQVDSSGTYLIDDAGSGLLGPLTGSSTLTNSQCALNGAGSGVANSGTTSTLTLSLTFKQVFNGAKNIYMYADDTSGRTSGWQTRGSYTVSVTGVPSAISVSPNAGSGFTQTFTALYSDTAGGAALNRRLFLINSSLNPAGACYVQADATGIYLVNDAGNALQSASALSNSQCTITGPSSGLVNSGNNSTLTLALGFSPTFAGAKTIYMYTEDATGNTGFVSRGTYTVTAATPSAVSVSPSSGSASSQAFSAVYSYPAGANYLNRRLFLINSSLTGAGACYVQADPNGIYLINDAGNGLLGPVTPGASVANAQCTLNGTGSSLVNSGSTSTLTAALVFKSPFGGAKNIYMYTEDTAGNNTGFQSRGTFSVPFAVPAAVSVSPASGSGFGTTFTAVYTDASGAAVLNRRLFLINSALNGTGACYVQADPTGIYLVNDAGSGLIGPVVGGNTYSNAQCTLNGTGTSLANSGTTSTLTASITFKPAFAGARNIYLYAEDNSGNNSGFQTRGTYTVASAPPTIDSFSPTSGAGVSQTFTAVYSDVYGATALNRRLFLINSTLNGSGACYIQADSNGLFLVTDAGNALIGPVTPGGTASNNQCTLNGTGSSINSSGNSSTVTAAITFKPAFAGAKNLYVYVEDTAGNNTGFQNRGTYTVTGVPSVPTNTSVTPNSGSGANRTFTLVYSDAAGNSLLNRRLFLVNATLNGVGACLVETNNSGIFLANDADSALAGPLFTNSSLTNSQCTINGAGASVSYSANSTTVVLPITFKPGFGGSRNIYMYVDDTGGNNSGWQLMGTITTQ